MAFFMNQLKIAGTLTNHGIIKLETKKKVSWSELSGEEIPKIPLGSNIELTISFDENEFISGKDGIVWATYNIRQAEIICNALSTLQISNEIQKNCFSNNEIYLIKTANIREIEDAIDFIWKSESGLRLKPDWNYPEGETNKSFELWLNEQ